MRATLLAVAVGAVVAGGCKSKTAERPYAWDLPAGFEAPPVPANNPMSAAKVELGRHLFYDTRLSYNQTQSCASCHDQELGFADGIARTVGSTGERLPRNSPGLVNVAYFETLTWVNPLLTSLERQIVVPMFGDNPVELGLAGKEDEVLERFSSDPTYRSLFARAFPDDARPVSVRSVVRALACFLRSMIAAGSDHDRYLAGDSSALSAAAVRGKALFESKRLRCSECHAGPDLTIAGRHVRRPDGGETFFNMGLYDIDGDGSYPKGNSGRAEFSGKPDDMGRIRVPPLRNIAVTGPYFHDGSAATLDDVITTYAAGGRGAGASSRHKDPRIAGFEISDSERADLVAFFDALTDRAFLADPRFGPPGPP